MQAGPKLPKHKIKNTGMFFKIMNHYFNDGQIAYVVGYGLTKLVLSIISAIGWDLG